ncbi:hypothetical protein T069G_05064 [Trichoderma breve]|uniref:Uncharacterized protein n=1 Tax=Trichoderma breve TaxID=2034170 RepID=A0A9W9E9M3_9HYPO|nr:hypothetical protein T069G_05064 [Trichoderma breve]KAJ4860076.1 hypothetical protein T069G_05064 [Trichoderma breve]
MPDLFCCSSIRPYRPQRLDHEHKFDKFMQWAKSTSAKPDVVPILIVSADYVVQLVRQANYGPQESVRYFMTVNDGIEFTEVRENDLIAANFEKLNSYKNFKCITHDKFFEVNLYQQNPTNRHHWRANIARPATDIDLVYRQKKEKSTRAIKAEDMKQADHDGEPEHVKTNLGSNPLLSLLSLDWVNTELSLGLEIEELWISELKSDNIAAFICSYVKSSADSLATYEVAKIESAVGLAIRRINFPKDEIQGRNKLQRIVEKVLDLCSASDWVSKCREGILRMFTAAPDERLLELVRRKEDEYEDTCKKMASEADCEVDDDDHYNQYDYGDDYDYNPYEASSPDFDQDLTACDKECGYCGRCPY